MDMNMGTDAPVLSNYQVGWLVGWWGDQLVGRLKCWLGQLVGNSSRVCV